MRKDGLADLIEAFVNGTSGKWNWDDFISVKQTDPQIEEIRRRCANLPLEFPPTHPGEYCSDGGVPILLNYVQKLREEIG